MQAKHVLATKVYWSNPGWRSILDKNINIKNTENMATLDEQLKTSAPIGAWKWNVQPF